MRHTGFVVVFQGRSGSSWVMDALDSHPDVLARGEVLIDLKSSDGADQIRWTERFLTHPPARCLRAAGFKTKLSDVVAPAAWANALRRANAVLLHLDRRNVVKQAVSWMRSELLHASQGTHNVEQGHRPLPPAPLDAAELVRRVLQLEAGHRKLAAFVADASLPTFHVAYEALLASPQREFRSMQEFLGVPVRQLRWSLAKNTRSDLRAELPNFDEVDAALACEARWSVMLRCTDD